jgi:hypothetical protein
MVTTTEMPSWVEGASEFARHFVETHFNNGKIQAMTPFFLLLPDGNKEQDDLQEQRSIYLIEYTAEYEDVGQQCDLAIVVFENHANYRFAYFISGVDDIVEVENDS